MLALKIVFWISLVLLVWTHVGYPLAAGLAARLRRRRVESSAIEPTVSIVVAAHNEEDVIERRVGNLLSLDYPAECLEILVASDASIDRTDEIVTRLAAEDDRVKLVQCARAGKVSAEPGGGRVDGRDRGVLRRERGLAGRRAADARPQLRRPVRGLRHGACIVRGRRR